MIENRTELRKILEHDALANNRDGIKCRLFGDEIWKWIVCYRKMDYFSSVKKMNLVDKLEKVYVKYLFHKLSVLLGYSIPIGKVGPGLSIAHVGTIVINGDTTIGKNLRIHEGVTIGATNGSKNAPQLGDNVFIGTGAKIIGDLKIASDVAIGANAVVVKDIYEPGTTWGGCLARKLSNHNSHSNLCVKLFADDYQNVKS